MSKDKYPSIFSPLQMETIEFIILQIFYATRVVFKIGGYLQVNALSEWIIGVYLHEFTNNEREISIPHEAAECGIENFEFIVSEGINLPVPK